MLKRAKRAETICTQVAVAQLTWSYASKLFRGTLEYRQYFVWAKKMYEYRCYMLAEIQFS